VHDRILQRYSGVGKPNAFRAIQREMPFHLLCWE
jgi:hypothetical protein